MKRKNNIAAFIGFTLALIFAMQINTAAQSAGQLLLNELEIDPPSATLFGCQYAEIRGQNAGGTVPANTYLISVNNDGAGFGFINVAVNFGGQTVGANNTITLVNAFLGACGSRTYGAGTNLITYNSPIGAIGQGSETFLVVQSTATLFSGQDVDLDDDGVFDAGFGITILDGVALNGNPEEDFVYGAEVGVVNISNVPGLDQPDALTRFPNNSTPFVAAAFYFGELASSPDETTEYAAPFSPNFPTGGALTPGAPNVGGTPTPTPTATPTVKFDFDGDRSADRSVFRPDNGTWFVQSATAGFSAVQFGQASDLLAPADYDGDRRTDVAVFRNVTAQFSYFFILQSATNTVRIEQFGTTGDVPVGGDWDGDQKDDVAVYRPGAQSNFFYRGSLNNPNNGISSIAFGTSEDRQVSADYDGDGRYDAAVFRPSNGTWYILQSAGNVFAAIPFGAATDRLVPADYNGDRRADIAVFRDGTWYAYLTPNNQFFTVQFGAAGDIPVPADYNGDGIAEQAVFRPSNGIWYSLNPNSSFTSVQFGAPGDRPVPAAYLQ